MIPEYLAVLVGMIMWLLGFMFAGVIYAETPFWDGVRTAFGGWHKTSRSAHFMYTPTDSNDPR